LVPPRERPPPLPLLLLPPPLVLSDREPLLLPPPPLVCPGADQEVEPQVLFRAELSETSAAASRDPPCKLPDELASGKPPSAPASSNK
jgi:hypothetical protein